MHAHPPLHMKITRSAEITWIPYVVGTLASLFLSTLLPLMKLLPVAVHSDLNVLPKHGCLLWFLTP